MEHTLPPPHSPPSTSGPSGPPPFKGPSLGFDSDSTSSRPDEYFFGLRTSLIIHVAVFLAVTFKIAVFPSKPVVYIPTLRVDLVGLPDILKKDLKNVAKTAPSKEVVEALKRAEEEAHNLPKAKPVKDLEKARPHEMVLKSSSVAQKEKVLKKKLQNALKRIKALDQISDDDSSEQTASPIIKGNKISPGTSLSGEAREAAQASFVEAVRDKLHDNWALPALLMRESLSARVRVYIDSYGRIPRYVFTRTSGNPKFDDEVKKAIVMSQPLPRPPADVQDEMISQGIEFGFPL